MKETLINMTDEEINSLSSEELTRLIISMTEEEVSNIGEDKMNLIMSISFSKFLFESCQNEETDKDEDDKTHDIFKERYMKAFNSLSDPLKAVKDEDNHRFRSLSELMGDMFFNVIKRMNEQDGEQDGEQ